MRFVSYLTAALLILSQNFYGLESKDEAALDQVLSDWTDVWNQSAGDGMAALYSEDADFVNIFGMHFQGQAEIEERHVEIQKTFLRNSIFSVINKQFREVNPNLVIALVQWQLDGFYAPRQDRNEPGETRFGRFTHVLVKSEGKWKITATQNTLIARR